MTPFNVLVGIVLSGWILRSFSVFDSDFGPPRIVVAGKANHTSNLTLRKHAYLYKLFRKLSDQDNEFPLTIPSSGGCSSIFN